MNKALLISLAASSLLAAENVVLEDILVESTLNDVNTQQVQSADTAEVLAKEVPSISLVRRSGVANDIILRGQKNDNINVLVDGGKIYGACPNRMDPPTSHVITPNIGTINVVEGPYDVEHAGTLSGLVSIDTVAPEKGIHGDFNVGFGSFGAKNLAGTVTGGNEKVQALVGVSGQWSDQYKDGNGNTFAEQIDSAILAGEAIPGSAYLPSYADHSAYDKRSMLAKLNVDFTDHIHLSLGYTGNRSEGILYPNSMMDAMYDNSDIYNLDFKMTDLGTWSKAFDIKSYYSYVDHSMSNEWRKAAMMKVMANTLTDTIYGTTVKNTTALTSSIDLTVGVDGSKRTWDGYYDQNGTYLGASINEAETVNGAFFAELQKTYANASVKVGLRYDDTKITSGDPSLPENTYQSFGANVFADYQLSGALGFFGGLGTASRVPDGKELYFQNNMGYVIGTPDLDQTTNYEVDLGMKNTYSAFNMKTRLFYSMLKNYIYYNGQLPQTTENHYVNIDAKIYGIEISGTWYMSDILYLDFGAAMQRGVKDKPLEGQTNENLADIPPLRGNIALNWNYSGDNFASAEVAASDKWSHIDDQNGEQEINAWAVVNLRVNHHFNRHFGMIAGVDNLFDETYAVSNTYKGLTLVTGANGTMLMNEPGRNVYANVTYNF